jgi:DNA-binding beta-propeller fold protein YncE
MKMRPRWALLLGLLLLLALAGCRALFNRPPVAVVRAAPTSGPAPLRVQFDGSGSYDPDGKIVGFQWDFGDGVQTDGQKATHTYRLPGSYRASLTVRDDLGAEGRERVEITVLEPSGEYQLLKSWGSWGAGEGELGHPRGIALDSLGQVLVADTGNDRVALFTSEGEFIENWGRYGAALGRFSAPQGIAISSQGEVYVLDAGNRRVQRLSSAGRPLGEWSIAEVSEPGGIAVGPDGAVYITDRGQHLIYKFSATGQQLARWGGEGNRRGQLAKPAGLAVASDGSVYVADTGNHRIQRFDPSGIARDEWGATGKARANSLGRRAWRSMGTAMSMWLTARTLESRGSALRASSSTSGRSRTGSSLPSPSPLRSTDRARSMSWTSPTAGC